jgi:hypothetical protein
VLSAIPSPSLKTLVKFNYPADTKRRLMSGKRRRMSEQTRATPCPARNRRPCCLLSKRRSNGDIVALFHQQALFPPRNHRL